MTTNSSINKYDELTHSSSSPIHNSLKYITLVRSIYALLVLVYCVVWFLKINTVDANSNEWIILGCVIEIFIFTTLCCISLLKHRFIKLFTYIGMLHDALLAAFFVEITGQISSPFLYLFLIVPLYGGIILQKKGGLIGASIVSIIIISALYILPHLFPALFISFNLEPYEPGHGFFIFYLVGAAYCVGLLTGHLSHLYDSVSHSLAKADEEFTHFKGIYAIMVDALPIGIVIISPDSGRVLYHNSAALSLLDNKLTIPQPTPNSLDIPCISRSGQYQSNASDDSSDIHSAPSADHQSDLYEFNDMKHHTPPDSLSEWTCMQNNKCLHIAKFTLSLPKHKLEGYHIIDFTSQYQAQKERAQRARLEHLGEFSAKVAHEIRNPLACISGCNEMLQLESQSEEQRQIHEMMNGEITRLNNLLNDILVFSRRPKLSPKNLNLLDIVNSQRDRFLEAKNHQTISFHIDIPDDISLNVDETSIRQILMTLWQNSSEAMRNNGSISIVASMPLQMMISDSGPGIPDDVVSHIFEPFFTTKPSGTGLGLATARQLAADNALNLDYHAELKAFVISSERVL